MRRTLIVSFVSLALIPGCGGGGGGGPTGADVPAAAEALDEQVRTGLSRSAWMLSNIETGLLFMLQPDTALAPGITVAPDPAAGDHAVTISGRYDGNADGIAETTVAGRAAFRSDPASDWTGLDGQLTIDVAIPIVGHVYHGDVAFAIDGDDRRLSGSGTFANPLNATSTTVSVPAGAPLIVRASTSGAGAAPNGCGYSLEGQARIQVEGPSGTLASWWTFSPASTGVTVHDATFTDAAGQATTLPDSIVELRCGGSGTIADWAASFDQQWACLPSESGRATIRIAVAGADRLSITDEDPPGSGDVNRYEATVLGASPHAVRGFFIAGSAGSRYREDFNWTLGKNGSGFTQVSSYRYIEGPQAGRGGVCVASARRLP